MKKIKTSIFTVLSITMLVIVLITISKIHYSTLLQNSNDKIHQLEILSNETNILKISVSFFFDDEDK